MAPAVDRRQSDHAHDLTLYRDSVRHLPHEQRSAPDAITPRANHGFTHLRQEPVHPRLDAVPTVQSGKVIGTSRVGDSLANFILLGHNEIVAPGTPQPVVSVSNPETEPIKS
jgi:hypothetical protein